MTDLDRAIVDEGVDQLHERGLFERSRARHVRLPRSANGKSAR